MRAENFLLCIVTLVCLATSGVESYRKPRALTETQNDGLQDIHSFLSSLQNGTVHLQDILYNPLFDRLLEKLISTGITQKLTKSLNDTVNLVTDINTFLGAEILVLDGDHIKINYDNLLDLIKAKADEVVEQHLGIHGIVLHIVQGMVNNRIDDYYSKFKQEIEKERFAANIQTRKLDLFGDQPSEKDFLRKLLLDLVVDSLRPLQPLINQTLVNISSQVLSFYQPILPSNYLQSMLTFALNQVIVKAVDILDSIRNKINSVLVAPTPVAVRSLGASIYEVQENRIEKKSIISVIVGPIKLLLGAILTPLHNLLKGLANYVFVTLRPVAGKVVLSPLENIVMAIINWIPCLNC